MFKIGIIVKELTIGIPYDFPNRQVLYNEPYDPGIGLMIIEKDFIVR